MPGDVLELKRHKKQYMFKHACISRLVALCACQALKLTRIATGLPKLGITLALWRSMKLRRIAIQKCCSNELQLCWF